MHIRNIREKKSTKDRYLSKQKNIRYSEGYISKQNKANKQEYKSTTKFTSTSTKKKETI